MHQREESPVEIAASSIYVPILPIREFVDGPGYVRNSVYFEPGPTDLRISALV